MDIETAIHELEREWNQVEPGGFFGELGWGSFDEVGFQRLKNILDAIEIPEGETLDRRFVEVIWFIPTFMRWQQEGWEMDARDTTSLREAVHFVEMRLTTILGSP
jgi:hypothetical protein